MIYGETNGVSDWHLELLKDYASIDDEYLHSVTFQEPQHEPLPDQINNIDECFPSEGQIFNSDDEAYEFYRLFARKNGFSIRREHVYNSVKHRSGILCRHAIRVLMVKNYFSLPSNYLPFRWRRESSLIPNSSHVVNNNSGSSGKFQSLIQCLLVESLKTKEREQVAAAKLEKVIRELKSMPENQEHVMHSEPDFPNHDGCDVENPIPSKSKGRPKGSRPKGGVEVAKKPRRCHVPNCGEFNHDTRNCPNKKKNLELSSQSPNKITKGWR
ncbi:hypothetical protein P8452_34920 [Trifolium repens]|nr:hypothetical protein P8452_34920 [Trifolium repens]